MKTFEIWQSPDSCDVTVLCRDDPDYDRKRAANLYLERGAVLAHSFQAEDWIEALARRNELLGWRKYDPFYIPGDDQ